MKKIISLTLSILFLAILALNLLAQEKANERANEQANEYVNEKVNYGEIMEDISVMARVIDKTLAGKFPGDYSSEKVGFFANSSGCEGIYLKGYGAIFTTNINFPLSAQKVEEKREVKPDDLWQQAKEEIEQGVSAFPVPGPKVETWVRYGDGFIAYDSGKVEMLKKELITLILTYGQNIRNLNPKDNIAIVVKGGAQTKMFTYEISSPYGSSDNIILPQSGVAEAKSGSAGVALSTTPSAQDAPVKTGIIITDVNEASSGEALSDDAKKQLEEAQKKLEEAKSKMGVAEMEAARLGAEVASNVAKQLATQEKELRKQISAVTSLKRNVKPSILTIKVSREDIMAQKNGRISTDEFMKRAEITQY